MSSFSVGQRVYAVPQGYLLDIGGDVRPVCSIGCPDLTNLVGERRVGVPMGVTLDNSGDIRPVLVFADCQDGGLQVGTLVKCIPQGYTLYTPVISGRFALLPVAQGVHLQAVAVA